MNICIDFFYIFDSMNYIEFIENANWKRTKHADSIPINV